jgi:hypothetical protein
MGCEPVDVGVSGANPDGPRRKLQKPMPDIAVGDTSDAQKGFAVKSLIGVHCVILTALLTRLANSCSGYSNVAEKTY